ncbi:alpha/beta fold hydrolase [Gordonia sp. JH63]|uniref:Alpha/beta fold hydrolase n=1 Tax=Gordonia hongkongensis TaxID=1701090 RepID=A0AAX3T4P4_9ACTN|nr:MULTISPECIES: alpha/beta fold hydrolase [Gordonia]QIK46864.1 alpha/beta hydrolase [Gordonia terrae]KSU57354.1 alpha/beta hydrolase [Gordonia sp. SGD-V-85]MBN0973907.1 alpha/beta fold hydrolase [Gordonia sp. BP-119]MBN0984642.1 alpha/beta fold hydrolase [Gordonia sp. BP-94]MCT1353553.1 alpha/beta hydrolase [Gordonia sp. p3-SID1431]
MTISNGATTVRFRSSDADCDAWFFPGAESSPFEIDGKRPVVVMAHGFAGTKDSGLAPYAQRFADAGLAVFAFDYRGFGLSGGEPRQSISLERQADDYRAAIGAAKKQPGVDPERIILWGVSQSGGHALTVAADRTDVAAVIAVVPLVNGLAAGRVAYAQVGGAAIARSTATAVASSVGRRLGRGPKMLRVVGEPGDVGAALTAPGFLESYRAIAGPSWRNEVDASVGLEIGSFRVDKHAARVDAPVLFQIADFDSAAPPYAASKTAFKAHAEVRHYPCDHFDIFAGNDFFEPCVTHEIGFLRRHLASNADVVEAATR